MGAVGWLVSSLPLFAWLPCAAPGIALCHISVGVVGLWHLNWLLQCDWVAVAPWPSRSE